MSRLTLGWMIAAAFVLGAGVASAAPASAASGGRSAVRHRAQPVDPTAGDAIDGDDLTVRRAAVEALGTRRGSVVVVDPDNGRVLTIVGQKLAFETGFIPCSTIKLVTALAALTEHVVERDTSVRIGRYSSFDMTTALAHSNNEYFGVLGSRLGFERVTRYARMMGLGEKAGLDISGEQPGDVAAEQPKGGMILMTAYGEGFQMTPLELAALLSAIANGGTLYYLQYPHSTEEASHLTPRVKRQLDVAPNGIDDIKMGMRGSVEYGTGRNAAYDPNEPILGKTGTCTDYRAGNFMGWFGSFNEVGFHRLVVVVMLASPYRGVNGGLASAVAGNLYRNLSGQRYFTADGTTRQPGLPEILVTSPCCSR
ncbi:MAG: penicillin-binding transpeptidase domain-containing protein [Bryobacteraceae bacterium]